MLRDRPALRLDSRLVCKYEVLSVIGKGSFSQVLRVQHRVTRQYFAVKLVSSDSGKYHGTHGYLPERAEMRATLVMYGPLVLPTLLTDARLIDIAPTIAPLLGLRLPKPDGRPLPLRLKH